MATTTNFPTTIAKPIYPLEEIAEDGVIRSQFENGMEQTRNRFTRRRRGYILRWSRMTLTDFATFETFLFTTISGGALSFNWTNPITNDTREYRITEQPRMSLVDYNAYSVECQIREV